MRFHGAQNRKFCALLVLAAGCFAASLAPAAAQQEDATNYPERAIRIIVSVPAGGGVDTVTRIVAEKLRQRFNQPVVVENRGGALTASRPEVVQLAARLVNP